MGKALQYIIQFEFLTSNSAMNLGGCQWRSVFNAKVEALTYFSCTPGTRLRTGAGVRDFKDLLDHGLQVSIAVLGTSATMIFLVLEPFRKLDNQTVAVPEPAWQSVAPALVPGCKLLNVFHNIQTTGLGTA